MSDNPNAQRTGGPGNASTGTPDQSRQPDSQKGSAANAVGEKDYVEKKGAPDVDQSGGRQPTDPVQSN